VVSPSATDSSQWDYIGIIHRDSTTWDDTQIGMFAFQPFNSLTTSLYTTPIMYAPSGPSNPPPSFVGMGQVGRGLYSIVGATGGIDLASSMQAMAVVNVYNSSVTGNGNPISSIGFTPQDITWIEGATMIVVNVVNTSPVAGSYSTTMMGANVFRAA
jgi:hypothetical protein